MMYAPLHAPGWSIALPLIALALYSRLRRSVGRQRVRPRRMSWRIGFLIFGTLMLGLSPPHSPALIAALFAGVVAGVGVAWFSLRHTRFEQVGDLHYYVPNLYIGLAVSALFIARIVYRLIVLAPQLQSTANDSAMPPWMTLNNTRTPLTLALLGLVLGYYAAYYLGVLLRSRTRSSPSVNIATPVPAITPQPPSEIEA